jgi:hypothetical protein
MDIPWHNWLVLGSEYRNIFGFVLFAIIRFQETFGKKLGLGDQQVLLNMDIP